MNVKNVPIWTHQIPASIPSNAQELGGSLPHDGSKSCVKLQCAHVLAKRHTNQSHTRAGNFWWIDEGDSRRDWTGAIEGDGGQLTAKIYAVRQLVHLGALPIMKYLQFAFALTVLTGCSQVFSTMDEVPKSQSETDDRKLIAKSFVTAFKDYASYNAVEISASRPDDSMFGHTSMTCVRFEAKGRRRVYVFFIRNNAVVDARYDVQTDQCGAQSYQPFDPTFGSARPVIAAPQNPLY